MKILMIAAEPREFGGVLAKARQATAIELAAHWARHANLGEHEMWLLANGAGRQRAAAAVEAAIAAGFKPQAIASIGFCGAVTPELAVADVVVADGAVEGKRTYCTVPATGGGRFVRGRLVTADHVVGTAEEKRAFCSTGAKVVDMEAGGVAERAEDMAVPFLGVKAVTDLAGETLQNDFQRALRPDGHLDTMEILGSGLKRPITRIPELFRLGVRCARASRALGVFFADCRI